MTGRERVRAALTFSSPDRIPRDLWVLPYVSLFRKSELEHMLEKFPTDIDTPETTASETENTMRFSTPGTYTDEWGSVWHVGEPGIIGEVKKPVLGDWSDLKSFHPPPLPAAGIDFDAANVFCERSDRFILSAVSARLFERLQFLRGTENLYMDLADDSREIRTLIDIVHGYYLENVTAWAKSDVDAVFLVDDWGSNKTLLINPDLWRSVCKPLYRQYCDIIHSRGKFVFFHSDGHIVEIIPDLIEIGVDALNAQLFCMDIEELGRRFKGKITFWGEIDRQFVLPFGTPSDVRNAVRRVRNAFGGEQGGVIAQCEWGKDVPRENVEIVFESWL
jgi:uroporphyrinogen decarboxylase